MFHVCDVVKNTGLVTVSVANMPCRSLVHTELVSQLLRSEGKTSSMRKYARRKRHVEKDDMKSFYSVWSTLHEFH